jgi:fumarate reductase (CoM/CoB) subunit A
VEHLAAEVLVVGAGAAGVRAALEAARAGAQVCLVTKGRIGVAGASAWGGADAAGFGASGLVDPEDGPLVHERDILAAAQSMADPTLARIVAADAPRQLLFLESLGVPFMRAGDGYLATRSCFSSRPRSIKVKGHGRPVVECLRRHLLLLPNVRVMEETTVTDPLLDEDGHCVGALASSGGGRQLHLGAAATILATGGAGRLFDANLNPADVTGDGYAFGLRAGAELINLEFMQAGFGILAPRGPGIFQYWLWDFSPALVSDAGESFLGRYVPPGRSIAELMAAKARHFPFSVSDVSRFMEIGVQSFINGERDAGREGNVWLRLSGIEARLASLPGDHNLKRMWSVSREFLLGLGVDLDSAVRVAPCAHAMNGGLAIDQFGRTSVEGLYAIGEVAGGPHGADRLGGNMFPTGQVFGERAGLHAAAFARAHRTRSEALGHAAGWGGTLLVAAQPGPDETSRLLHELQRRASRALLVVREAAPLMQFLAFVGHLKTRCPVPATPNQVEFRSLLLVAEAMATAALLREESRGGHYRSDFPERREAWDRRIVLRLDSSGGIRTRVV